MNIFTDKGEEMFRGSWSYLVLEVWEPKAGWPPLDDVVDEITENRMVALAIRVDDRDFLATLSLWKVLKAKVCCWWEWEICGWLWRRLKYMFIPHYRKRMDEFDAAIDQEGE